MRKKNEMIKIDGKVVSRSEFERVFSETITAIKDSLKYGPIEPGYTVQNKTYIGVLTASRTTYDVLVNQGKLFDPDFGARVNIHIPKYNRRLYDYIEQDLKKRKITCASLTMKAKFSLRDWWSRKRYRKSLDKPIPELNGHTLREVFGDTQIVMNGTREDK